jgi:hypothetical protein
VIQSSETRSGNARVPECAWVIPSNLVGIEFPAGMFIYIASPSLDFFSPYALPGKVEGKRPGTKKP